MSAPVDVLAVLVQLCSFGGDIEARRVISAFNVPRSTGAIRSHLRRATTAQVRSALRKAEAAGDVERTSAPLAIRSRSAAAEAELHWRISPAALARAGGAA